MDSFSIFKSAVTEKVERLQYGQNQASDIATHKHILVVATQPVADFPINYSYRIDGEYVFEDQVITMMNGDTTP